MDLVVDAVRDRIASITPTRARDYRIDRKSDKATMAANASYLRNTGRNARAFHNRSLAAYPAGGIRPEHTKCGFSQPGLP